MKTSPSLDQRIANAIKGELKTAAACSDLLQEVETAAAAAVRVAEELAARAVDPTVIDDEAPDKANAAKIRVQRLNAALPSLRSILANLMADEYRERWEARHQKAAAKQTKAAQSLARYPELVAEMIDIFREVEEADKECSQIDFDAPDNEPRRLGKTELLARNLKAFSAAVPSLLKMTQLPDWVSGKLIWPPAQPNLAAAMFASPVGDPSTTSEWWRAGEEERAADEERAKQNAKDAEIARKQFYALRP